MHMADLHFSDTSIAEFIFFGKEQVPPSPALPFLLRSTWRYREYIGRLPILVFFAKEGITFVFNTN